jgi:hypothetical protein
MQQLSELSMLKSVNALYATHFISFLIISDHISILLVAT